MKTRLFIVKNSINTFCHVSHWLHFLSLNKFSHKSFVAAIHIIHEISFVGACKMFSLFDFQAMMSDIKYINLYINPT